jgi:hypothetical protein
LMLFLYYGTRTVSPSFSSAFCSTYLLFVIFFFFVLKQNYFF